MSFDLKYFYKCKHRIVAEPIYVDPATLIAELSSPIFGTDLNLFRNNIETNNFSVIRDVSSTEDFLKQNITEITSVYQDNLGRYTVTRKAFKAGIDYQINTNRDGIEWLVDLSSYIPSPGSLYYVDFLSREELQHQHKIINSYNIKINNLDDNSTYDLDYSTSEPYCPLCRDHGVAQDFDIGTYGDFTIVAGEEKLKQDVLKFLLTNIRTNPFFLEYGTDIERSIGRNADPDLLTATLNEQVRKGLELLQRMQRVQMTEQALDPAEVISDIKRVSVTKFPQNPTAYYIDIELINAQRKTIEIFAPLDDFNSKVNKGLPQVPQITISRIVVDNITKNSATIYWETSQETETILEYGKDQNVSNRTLGNIGLRHFVYLENLESNKTYFYRTITINSGVVLASKTHNFTTK